MSNCAVRYVCMSQSMLLILFPPLNVHLQTLLADP